MGLRLWMSGLCGASLAALLPAPALAGRVALGGGSTSPVLTYVAAPGERNLVRISLSYGTVQVEDRAGVRAGSGCRRGLNSGGRVAICPIEGGITTTTLSLGDGHDRAAVELPDNIGDVVLSGGPGNDVLRATPGRYSRFAGGRGNDVMSGGGHRTVFDEGSRPNGSDTMRAPQLKQERYGWAVQGEAWVDYGARRGRVTADLDGARDDGERDERDLLGAGVTGIAGGRSGDRLTGGSGHNQLIGGPGADLLRGRGGDDALVARTTTEGLYLPGRVVNRAGRDRLLGGRGQDLLEGSAGADLLVPGPGPDDVNGGDGADRIRAVDGFVDEIRCGAARDEAREDELDVLRQCERFSAAHRGAVPVEISSYVSHCRYGPPCDHPWHARVVAECAGPRAARCTGTVTLLLNGQPVGEAAFRSGVAADIEVSQAVQRLLARWDPRLSVTVASAGREVTVGVSRLPGYPLTSPEVAG
jgi:RTX calcium-binding nonapeptide repeat (4 copies)